MINDGKVTRQPGNYHVYVVECRDGSYYTGYTPDIERRLKLHNAGKGAKYTRGRRPVKLILRKKYRQLRSTLLEEARIKRLTWKEKEALVNAKGRGAIAHK